jgi:hypothetical protein
MLATGPTLSKTIFFQDGRHNRDVVPTIGCEIAEFAVEYPLGGVFHIVDVIAQAS